MKRRRLLVALASAGLLTAAMLANVAVTSAGLGSITLCHQKGPDAKNGWNELSISPDSAADPVKGHDGHANDIIPAFDLGGGVSFGGQNLTTDFDGATGQQILDNDCVHPDQSEEPATDAPTEPPTDTSEASKSGPADGTWLLLVALGVLLASIVVVSPARAKGRR
jgi:hypothetical protein